MTIPDGPPADVPHIPEVCNGIDVDDEIDSDTCRCEAVGDPQILSDEAFAPPSLRVDAGPRAVAEVDTALTGVRDLAIVGEGNERWLAWTQPAGEEPGLVLLRLSCR